MKTLFCVEVNNECIIFEDYFTAEEKAIELQKEVDYVEVEYD